MNKAQDKRYLLAFYPFDGTKKCSMKVVLCKNTVTDTKKLYRHHGKKILFALESSA